MSGKPNKGGRGRQNWGTPQWLFDRIEVELGVKFEVDVCAEEWSAKCPRHFDEAMDGLAQDWAGLVFFCNPPFSTAVDWIIKGYLAARDHGAFGVFVLPTSTDTSWFHEYALKGVVLLLRGRVQFVEPPGTPPRYDKSGKLIKNGNNGGSMIVVFRKDLLTEPPATNVVAVEWRKP